MASLCPSVSRKAGKPRHFTGSATGTGPALDLKVITAITKQVKSAKENFMNKDHHAMTVVSNRPMKCGP